MNTRGVMAMNVSGSSNLPHYDDVIKSVKEKVLKLGDKDVTIQKATGFSKIASVFGKHSSTQEGKSIQKLLNQAETANKILMNKIENASSNEELEELIAKQNDLVENTNKLKSYLPADSSISDRVKKAFGRSKDSSGGPTIADKIMAKADAIKSALTPKRKDALEAIQELKNQHQEAVSAFKTSYNQAKEAKSKSQDAAVLTKALNEAEVVMRLSSPATEKLGADTLRINTTVLTNTANALNAAVRVTQANREGFLGAAGRKVDALVARFIPESPEKPKLSQEMKGLLMAVADQVGVNAEKRALFLQHIDNVKDAESLKSFMDILKKGA